MRTAAFSIGTVAALAGLPVVAAQSAGAVTNGSIAYTVTDNQFGNSGSAMAVLPPGGSPTVISAGAIVPTPVLAAFPTYSPNGKQVAFSRGSVEAVTAIYLAAADGANAVQITQTVPPAAPAYYQDAVAGFSPDGKTLAFTRRVYTSTGSGPEFEASQVWVVDIASKVEKHLSTSLDNVGFGASGFAVGGGSRVFSADGTHVVFANPALSGGGDDTEVFRADITAADQTTIDQVTDFEAGSTTAPQYSPDGTRIAFGGGFGDPSSSTGGRCGVFTVGATATDVEQGDATPVSTFECDDATVVPTPVYSPKGTSIAFAVFGVQPGAFETPLPQVMVAPAGGGAATPLTNVPAGDIGTFPLWSPDGSQLAFTQAHIDDQGTPSSSDDVRTQSLRVVSVSDPTHTAGPVLASGSLLVPSSWQGFPDGPADVCTPGAPVPAGYKLIEGNSGNNKLTGTSGKDVIRGGGGNDVIRGGGGDDILCGNNGRDRLLGNKGDDVLRGGGDIDVLIGGRGDDVLRGDARGDEVRGGSGNDVVDGGQGNDTLSGGKGRDELIGGRGEDTGNGGPGDDSFRGVEHKTQ